MKRFCPCPSPPRLGRTQDESSSVGNEALVIVCFRVSTFCGIPRLAFEGSPAACIVTVLICSRSGLLPQLHPPRWFVRGRGGGGGMLLPHVVYLAPVRKTLSSSRNNSFVRGQCDALVAARNNFFVSANKREEGGDFLPNVGATRRRLDGRGK